MKTRHLWMGLSLVVVLLVAGCVDGADGLPAGPGLRMPPQAAGGASDRAIGEDPAAAPTPVGPSATPSPTRTPLSLATPYPTAPPATEAAADDAQHQEASVEASADEAVSAVARAIGDDPAESAPPAASSVAPAAVVGAAATGAASGGVALARIEDVDPAPPLTIIVDAVRLIDDEATYKITGWIRNDGSETYEDVGLAATFYAGTPWHFGPFEAATGCYTLTPGQRCAFAVEAYARDYTGYRLHPEGDPIKAWTGSATSLTVDDVAVAGSAAGYVRVTGVVRNDTGAPVDPVRVSGRLSDGAGRTTSVGTTILVGRLVAGAQMAFDLQIPADAYATVEVTAEGQVQ